MSLTKVSYSMIEGATANVLDFGAVGNGVANDTAAIQAAIDYFGGNQGTVFFPNGSYKLGSNVTGASNITLLGYGAEIVCNGFGFNFANRTDVTIDGLFFNQTFVTGTPTTITSGTNRLTVKNCYFYGGGFYGIALSGDDHSIINNRFTDTPSQSHVVQNSTYNTIITGNQFFDIGLGYNLLVRNSFGTTISNNTFKNITNNPIFLDTGTIKATVTNNVLLNCGDNGILTGNDLSGSIPEFITIANNVIDDSPDAGIGIIYGENITIANNVLTNNGATGAEGYNSGIYLSGNAKYVSITGNTLNNRSYNPSAVYGIYAFYADTGADTTQTTYIQIANNVYSGYASGRNLQIPFSAGGVSWQPAKMQILEGASREYPSNANLNFEAWASTLPDNITGLTTFGFSGSGATCTKETSTVVYGNSAKIVGGAGAGILSATLTALNFFEEPCLVEVTAFVKPNSASDGGYVELGASISGGSPAPSQKVTFGGDTGDWRAVTLRMVVGDTSNLNIKFVANAGQTVFFDETTVKIQIYNN